MTCRATCPASERARVAQWTDPKFANLEDEDSDNDTATEHWVGIPTGPTGSTAESASVRMALHFSEDTDTDTDRYVLLFG